MRPRPVRRGGARPPVGRRGAAVLVVAALAATTGGCGGDDAGDGGPSAADYYAAMNGFCGQVTAAARAVSRTSAAAAKGPADARVKRISTALETFADATEEALGKLERTGAPTRFATYQRQNADGFRRYITTLRDAASDPKALARLQSRVDRIELPDPPQDLTENARSCASFSPAG